MFYFIVLLSMIIFSYKILSINSFTILRDKIWHTFLFKLRLIKFKLFSYDVLIQDNYLT